MKQQIIQPRAKSIHIKEAYSSRLNNFKSLPKLIENNKTSRYSEHLSPSPKPKFYNHWYIPYEKRFMEQKELKNFHDEIRSNYAQMKEDPLFLYHNLNRPLSIHQDPFSKPDKNQIQKIKKYDKTKIFLEMNKSSGVLKLFLEDLVQKKQRVPAFLMNEQLIL
ncbi:unnamed protein product [Paramecium primaurelia]|uniref:Uncharacterized protein n=1 Tax=Paramecium primaurelia TaxID=5886 RepID=A0A8S1NXA9_PARPR|nr:unnamed protein product [Paramecium primaurelia]